MNYLGLEKKELTKTVKDLNKLLASYHVYYQNLRNCHWNINGRQFFTLHVKFEELYNDARVVIDKLAERILTLRYQPMSRLTDYLKNSEVSESKVLDKDTEMVEMILENHKVLIEQMRKVLDSASKAGDEGTIDMVGGFLEGLETKSWMLDAWRAAELSPVK